MKKIANAQDTSKKKGKKKWIIIGGILVVLIVAVAAGNNGDDTQNSSSVPDSSAESIATAENTTEFETESVVQPSYALEHGELMSVITNEIDGKNVIVVKAKITPSYNNKATVDQNYYNVESLIREQGCDSFDELQYWAVATMTDGSEQKVVAFTISSSLIKMIVDGSVPANQLGDYVDDLYILPSLQS